MFCIPGMYDENCYKKGSGDASVYYQQNKIEKALSTIPSSGVDFVLSGEWAYG